MIGKLLRGTEWSQLRDLVSPTFFEVLPAGRLAGQVGELASNYGSRSGFKDARGTRADALAEAGLGVALDDDARALAKERPAGADPAREARGQRLLELYFHQIFHGQTTLLDLRPERAALDDDEVLRWAPAAMWITWKPDFIEPLRELYAGFYEDEDARFLAALDRLSIRPAEDTFRRQFGAGDQSAVSFDVAAFRDTFHEAFIRCRDAGAQLHPNFLALGIYLATLYLHLEELGGTFDVRTAFFRGRGER